MLKLVHDSGPVVRRTLIERVDHAQLVRRRLPDDARAARVRPTKHIDNIIQRCLDEAQR